MNFHAIDLLRALLLASMCAGCSAYGEAPRESLCPGGRANPDLMLCEGFEDAGVQRRWDIRGNHGTWPAAHFAMCSDDHFGFNDRCAAWSNWLAFDRQWGYYGYDARRAFQPAPAFYVRWYQYISDPFVWGTLEDKSVMLHDAAETIVAYVGTDRNHLPVEPNSGPGKPFVANYQDVDIRETGGQFTRVNRFQNQGRNITLQPGKWYLFEWYLELNTPGESNGVTRLWIDEASGPIASQTLRMEYTDMRWLKRSDAGKQFGLLRLTVYHQRCDMGPNTCPPNGPAILQQSQRWDEIVISRRRIGALAASQPVLSTSR